jgi:serine/threonine protein kinase
MRTLDVYVSDFCTARQEESKNSKGFKTTLVGPIKWEAPESLPRKEYSEKTDAFSSGVGSYELVCGRDRGRARPTRK